MKSPSPTSPDRPSPRRPVIDRIIETEEDLRCYLDDLRGRGVGAVCLDLEGDQGSIRYAYAISIFQVFDGQEAVIIDVLRTGACDSLREFLTAPDITKIMFSCPNDVYMCQNVLGCTIYPVRDIAIGQKLLGLPINLSSYLNIDRDLKDQFQRANWLRRPIRPELLEYAINDVLLLFTIENEILLELDKASLLEKYVAESRATSDRDFVINQRDQYLAKFPGYTRLPAAHKKLAAALWLFRELLGEHFDCPVGYLLSKKAMAQVLREPSEVVLSLERELNRQRGATKKIPRSLIERFFEESCRLHGLAWHQPLAPRS